MFKKILSFFQYPFVVPKRINRTTFVNKKAALFLLDFIVSVALIKINNGDPFNITTDVTLIPDDLHFNSILFFECAFFIILYIFSLITFWRLIIARLHDFNYSGWWSLLILVPLLDILLLLLFFIRGSENDNKYGKPNRSNKFSEIIGVIFITIMTIPIILLILFMSASVYNSLIH